MKNEDRIYMIDVAAGFFTGGAILTLGRGIVKKVAGRKVEMALAVPIFIASAVAGVVVARNKYASNYKPKRKDKK